MYWDWQLITTRRVAAPGMFVFGAPALMRIGASRSNVCLLIGFVSVFFPFIS